MAFPSSPSANALATVNGITYVYSSTKTAWLRASTTGANLTANSLSITSGATSSSTTTGALLVTGGAGIQGAVYIGGQLNATATTASSGTGSGALVVGGGVGIAGNCFVGSTLTTTTLVETSSINFKENVTPIIGALDLILQLNGVTYDRKDGSTKNEAGLIAEDVEKILPNLVTRDEHGDINGIQYTKLTAYLIEAVKSLKDEIDQLKKSD
jgi:hypothetical protein